MSVHDGGPFVYLHNTMEAQIYMPDTYRSVCGRLNPGTVPMRLDDLDMHDRRLPYW